MTLHAEEEMDEDGLSIFDVESAMLTGTIVEHQKDRRSAERKYCLVGPKRRRHAHRGRRREVRPFSGRLVIVTVYAEPL